MYTVFPVITRCPLFIIPNVISSHCFIPRRKCFCEQGANKCCTPTRYWRCYFGSVLAVKRCATWTRVGCEVHFWSEIMKTDCFRISNKNWYDKLFACHQWRLPGCLENETCVISTGAMLSHFPYAASLLIAFFNTWLSYRSKHLATAALGNLDYWHSWPELTTVHRVMKRMRAHVKEPGVGMGETNPIDFNLSDLLAKARLLASLSLLFLGLSLSLSFLHLFLPFSYRCHPAEIMHMHGTKGKDFQGCKVSFISWSYQESGNHVHPDTLRLGSMSGKNDARDFWSFNKLPVAAWPEVAACHISGCLGTGAHGLIGDVASLSSQSTGLCSKRIDPDIDL